MESDHGSEQGQDEGRGAQGRDSFETCLAFAMERGEESRPAREPPVDRVGARVRRSRPVGLPPSINIFDAKLHTMQNSI